jgi:site-specific recombinase XerD
MGKGAKEIIVPIGKYIQLTLWPYIDKVRPTPFDPECNSLFLSPSGKPITANAIKLFFSRLAKISCGEIACASVPTHIRYKLLAGDDIFSLKEILGHTTLDMVNHYLHFTSSQITAQHHKYSPIDKLHEANKL